tara:strand:- start:955 stop:1632 length:678 start_codon:yes stop_codon:yes gene_type:complete
MKQTLCLFILLPILIFGQMHFGGGIGINNSRYIGSAFDSDYVNAEIQFLSTPSFHLDVYADIQNGIGLRTGLGIAQYGLKTKGDPYWTDMISIDKRTYLTVPLRVFAHMPKAKISPFISLGLDTRIALSGVSITKVQEFDYADRVIYSELNRWKYTRRLGVAPSISLGVWKKQGAHNFLLEFEFAVNQVPLYNDNYPISDFEAKELSFGASLTYLFSTVNEHSEN